MKSVAIFLTLVFLTGFKAAVLSEEPPPSISESKQSVLEQFQEQFGKVSTQVTDSINGGLDAIKERTSDLVAYTSELGKRYTSPKFVNRKFYNFLRDFQTYGQNVLSQSKEAMKDHYKKIVDTVEEVKKHPTTVALHEEMVEPIFNKCHKLVTWLGDQSIASVTTMVQKKFTY